jgi:hypothetical protein
MHATYMFANVLSVSVSNKASNVSSHKTQDTHLKSIHRVLLHPL